MLAAVRRDKIKTYILEKKDVTVAELSETFSVSEETIRRDLRLLEEEGTVVRTHGGAMLSKRVKSTVDNKILGTLFTGSKKIIAAQCGRFIRDGDCIFLDASTTAYAICDELGQRHVTVLTNSLRVISCLAENKNVKLIGVGGNFLSNRQCFVGRETNESLSHYFVDIAFISCRSLSMKTGITDSDDDAAEVKQIITRHATRVCLIADYTKFDKTSFTRVCSFRDINDIVTDRPLPKNWLRFAHENQIAVWDTCDRMNEGWEEEPVPALPEEDGTVS